jgi:NADPH:quinone reductase-like Zn-dependent oxidoreductase
VSPEKAAVRRLHLARPGTLDGVELVPAAVEATAPHEVRIRVLAAGVNFRDVLVTLGMYPGDAPPLGAECSGVVVDVGASVTEFRSGDRVVGFAPGSMASEVSVPAAFVAPLPHALTSEAAAGLPVAFLTAHYGLHELARLQPGERILIHAGTGGVGMAAVQLAKRCGATVFATAGSPEKREWLRAHGVEHVMDSRSLAFVAEIAAATNGEGVDVVLNSLAGEFIRASFQTLGRAGRFLELGKRDILTVADAAALRPDVRYCAYDLGAEAHANPALIRPMLDEILAGLADGSLEPLPVTSFALGDAPDAFRHMAQARHIGKIVLRVAAGEDGLVTPNGTYWVTGGFGALGLETARWLVRSGARSLVLSGRRQPGAEARADIAVLERDGVNVYVAQGDIADGRHVQQVLDHVAAGMPPLRGIVHAAGAVRDAVLMRQRWEDCREVLRGKAHGALLLDEMTRTLPLDFFVLYSAAGALLGAAGQGMYPAANLELDALARTRRARGLPALSVAWGMWADKGMAAAERGHDVWAARGLHTITPDLGFACLERLLRNHATCGVVLPIDWTRFLSRLPDGLDRDFFRGVAPSARDASAAIDSPSGPAFCDRLSAMAAGQRRQAVLAHIGACARQVLGLDEATLVPAREPLKDLGLDSLTAMELRNTLVRSIKSALPATLLFDYPTPDQLAGYLMRALGYERAASEVESDGGRVSTALSDATAVAALSDDDAEAQLLAELERGSAGRSRV